MRTTCAVAFLAALVATTTNGVQLENGGAAEFLAQHLKKLHVMHTAK